jgi:TfoX/Sxy family transcriptional regulator of competence genes
MASDQNFVNFILEQLSKIEHIQAKKMFGEFGLYAGDKIFGLICDNKLFIKPTQAGQAFIGHPQEVPPYTGAKNYFLIEDKVEDSDWLCALIRLTLEELPATKPKKKKKNQR